VFLILVVAISICNAQGISDEMEKKLLDIGNIIQKATVNGDYKTILKFYDEDIIIMPDFNPAIRGIKNLEEAYEKDSKKGVKYHSFTGSAEKRWLCGNEIYERGTFGMAVSSRESKIPRAYYGSYFQIWKICDDGSLKIKYTIWNLDFNPFDRHDDED